MKPNRILQIVGVFTTFVALFCSTLRAEYTNNMADDDDELFGSAPTFPASGVSTWTVSEPYINLWIFTQPLTYSTSSGEPMGVALAWKHRNTRPQASVFGFGPGWECSWLNYAPGNWSGGDCVGGTNMYVALGGVRHYVADGVTKEFKSSTTLSKTSCKETVNEPSGGKENYDFFSAGGEWNCVMTQQIDPHGRTNRFSCSTPGSTFVRLDCVVDWDGLTNTINYDSTFPKQISRITDPYGRSVNFGYDGNGRLSSITNAVGLVDRFSYDAQGMITTLITAYGTNSFKATTNGFGGGSYNLGGTNEVNRSLEVTNPDGTKELFAYRDQSTKLNPSSSVNLIPASYQSAEVPNTSGLSNTFDNSYLDARNTFSWSAYPYSLLSAGYRTNTSFNNLTTNDYNLATLKHWMRDSSNQVKPVLSLQRASGPTNTLVGQKTWLDYAGKAANYTIGTNINPSFTALVLPDATTRFSLAERTNKWEKPTRVLSTYSSGGSVATRTNAITYSSDGIDMVTALGFSGELISSNAYNSLHLVTTNFNALGDKTTYLLPSFLLLSVQWPGGCVTTNTYTLRNNPSAYWLTQTADLDSPTGTVMRTSYAGYTQDTPTLLTDARGRNLSGTYDALRRPTNLTCTNNTFINQFARLDMTGQIDPAGYTNLYSYDPTGRLEWQIDKTGFTNWFGYSNGVLLVITNALKEVNAFTYDAQGHRTKITYHDGSADFFSYNPLGQLTSSVDAAGVGITNYYNNQGLLTVVSNAYGRVLLTQYDLYDRVTNSVDANGFSMALSYDLLNRVTKRTYPDGTSEAYGHSNRGLTAFTNRLGKVTTYGLDALGRKIAETNANAEVVRYTYNSGGDLLQLVDAKNATNRWTYDGYGHLTSYIDDYFRTTTYTYNQLGRRASRTTPAFGTNTYTYNAAGDLLSGALGSYSYDALHRVTNAVGPTGLTVKLTYTSFGALQTEDGPWANDTVTYYYKTNHLRSAFSVEQPSASPWTVSYGFDAANGLQTIIDPNGTYAYSYPVPGSLVNKLTFPSGAYVTNVFDSLNRVVATSLKNSSGFVLNSHSYQYNAENQRTRSTRTEGSYVDYTYDNIGQLKSAFGKEAGGGTRLHEQFGYLYDAAGSLTTRTNNALQLSFSVGSCNEPLSATYAGTLTVAGTTGSPATSVNVNTLAASLYGDNTFARAGFSLGAGVNTFTALAQDGLGHSDTNTVSLTFTWPVIFQNDADGNLTYDGRNDYQYLADGQLRSINDNWPYFGYDAFGRLRGKTENGVENSRYVYVGNLVVQERDASNVPLVTYTRGKDLSGGLEGAGGIGGLLARTDNTTFSGSPLTSVAYYGSDGNGNVTMLVNGNQAPVAKYLYDPFGNTISASGSLADANTYRFSSKEIHPASGLYYFGQRWYNPNLQRWMGRDPSGLVDGPNLYAYVNNRSTYAIDPWGLETVIVINENKGRPAGAMFDNWREGYSSSAGRYEWREVPYPEGGNYPLDDSEKGSLKQLVWVDSKDLAKNPTERMFESLRDQLRPAAPFVKLIEGLVSIVGTPLGEGPVIGKGIISVIASKSAVVPIAVTTVRAAVAGEHFVLGLENFGARSLASKLGARYLGGIDGWREIILKAIANKGTRFTVSLDGLAGEGTWGQVMNSVQKGATPLAGATDWELLQLRQAGRLKDAILMRGGNVVRNPF